MASTAISLSSSGPSVSGKPWPRLTDLVARASSDMVAKIVVVKGCSRRVRCASPAADVATAMIVPVAIRLAYRRPERERGTVLSIANYNMHCGMDGWGRRYDYVAAIASLDADIIVLEEAWTAVGDGGGGQAGEVARH